MRSVRRRRFLAGSATAALATAAAPNALGRAVLAGARSPNEKVVLASIGVGGRGSSLLRGFLARGDVECAYVCDLDPGRGGDCLRAVENPVWNRAPGLEPRCRA